MQQRLGLGGHQSAKMKNDEWLTPPEIVHSLGNFDLDPCSPINRPWDTAKKHYSLLDDGLSQPWEGRVWLNPPYGREANEWLEKMFHHGSGIALIFARTETQTWHRYVWPAANSIFFLEGRVTFHHVDGTRGTHSGGAPSVLVAYTAFDNFKIRRAISDKKIKGYFVVL